MIAINDRSSLCAYQSHGRPLERSHVLMGAKTHMQIFAVCIFISDKFEPMPLTTPVVYPCLGNIAEHGECTHYSINKKLFPVEVFHQATVGLLIIRYLNQTLAIVLPCRNTLIV